MGTLAWAVTLTPAVPSTSVDTQDPVSMQLIRERLAAGDYYATLDIFAADFRRMFANARCGFH